MKQIILNGIYLDELIDKISEAIQSKNDKAPTSQVKTTEDKFLTRSEVAKLLKISLPTLHEWTKMNLLQSYKIGSRVLYKRQEVEKTLEESSKLKFKRNRQ